jgi:hypothetical protein
MQGAHYGNSSRRFARIQIGSKFVPRYSSGPFELENALSWDSAFQPFCNRLRRDLCKFRERPLSAGAFNEEFDTVHGAETYTYGLLLSTAGLADAPIIATHNKPMVDAQRVKRPNAAPSPCDFTNFTEWLHAATDQRQWKADLAHYVGGSSQKINKWLNENAYPKDPAIRELVAEWAQVPDSDLLALIDKWLRTRPKKTAKKNHREPIKPRTSSRKLER